ncbi:MAG: hypothetical protein WAV38_35230 [Xanthobacteraceae bacterium]
MKGDAGFLLSLSRKMQESAMQNGAWSKAPNPSSVKSACSHQYGPNRPTFGGTPLTMRATSSMPLHRYRFDLAFAPA